MVGFLAELKRRSVFKVGIAYAATAWLVIEIASVLLPTFKAPTWALQAFATLVILGFPIALVLAWAFELTPEGVRRTADVALDPSLAAPPGRRLDFIIIAVLVASVAILIADRMYSRSSSPETSNVAAGAAGEPAATQAASDSGAPAALTSIAVLPFVNLSSDPEQEYFSDGLTEELLSRLSRIPTLKVPARTSSFFFKGRNVELRDIGRMLGVWAVLEGSVRRSGDRLRITAELSDSQTGYRIWSESYDRAIADVFAVQDDITTQITTALKVRLESGPPAAGTEDRMQPETYQLMLRGRYYWNQRTPDGFAKAVSAFQEVTRRDPTNARAYAGLADAYLSQFDYGLLSWEDSTPRARAAATRALELDDDLAEAHTSLAHILLHEWHWNAAEEEFRRAIELDPNYTVAHHWHALCLTALGRVDDAVTTMERAQQLDPVSVRVNADLGMAYLAAGRYNDAIVQEERTLELAPEADTPKWIRGMALEQLHRFDEAEADLTAVLADDPSDASVMGSLGHLYAVTGQEKAARRVLSQLIAQADGGESAFFVTLIYAGLDEPQEALNWLGRAVDEHSGSVRYLKVDPRLAGLREQPGYRALIERVGLPL
jgi:adenylate cyclase